VQFTKLRLTGFKSFVDPTELDISPGITGVVGPNGCGKSNLVEGLKWVMGETSAKQMRGSEMDDVIFAGTSNRPSRNIAEAILYLDNADRKAPSQFNDATELEISRRIEREKGSTYRVNSKEVRAKDVHLLFADAASGARSTALVSQGHIGAIVSAKPVDRRKLLEEAAGITGLHSRRHEAELRLRAAETNLERLDDVMVTLEAQMASLKKQARQATRYRNLNDHIRKAEATLFLLRWNNVEADMEKAGAMLSEAETAVAELAGVAGVAATEQAEVASALPELRQLEAEAAAALQRLTLARENLEAEEQRLEQMRRNCETRLAQIDADTTREKTLANDAKEATERLSAERGRLTAGSDEEQGALTEASAKLEEARTSYESAEQHLSEVTSELARTEARRNDLERRCGELSARIAKLTENRDNLTREVKELEAQTAARDDVAQASREVDEAATAAEQAREHAQTAETARTQTANRVSASQSAAHAAATAATKLETEISTLAEIVETGDPDLWPPMIDAVTVTPGFETALGAALGDDLTAATDEAAPVHWRANGHGDGPALPAGAEPLSQYVQGPGALMRRLSQIGVVADADTGRRLLPQLQQGQRLVSRDGDFWRWDGYAASAEVPTAAATRLKQRNRLAELRGQLVGAQQTATAADAEANAARVAAEEAARRDEQARTSLRDAESKLSAARDALATLRQKLSEADSWLTARRETLTSVTDDLRETEAALAEAHEASAALPDLDEEHRKADEVRTDTGEKRATFLDCQSTARALQDRAQERRQRIQEITDELESWGRRQSGAEQQIAQLTERRTEVAAELEALQQRPEEIAAQRMALLDQVSEAEAKRKEAADTLAAMETRLADADRHLRDAEHKVSEAREQRVRAEAAVEQAKQSAQALGERMRDRLECGPEALRDLAELGEEAQLPDLESAERKVERLLRERDNMGPVNLRAEVEAQELDEQMTTLTTEREDLIKAIEKLRRGINELNREGRERLLASYHEVDKHFQELFTRLFAGGRAHLTLTDSEDPLEAGIEIMASPPGKRLQVLSLLSGGEQALTALALLFAVFLTNPAPICVLDEVDAPLDDANVDRFCTLVEEIAHSLSTRFLVITHHRMTMARVDRLFGVTMSEQGVSQLVSVDLGQAMALRETA